MTEAGYTDLLFAENGQSALEILGINVPQGKKVEAMEIDLVLLDIVLPDKCLPKTGAEA